LINILFNDKITLEKGRFFWRVKNMSTNSILNGLAFGSAVAHSESFGYDRGYKHACDQLVPQIEQAQDTGYLAGLNAGRKETQKSYNTGYLAGLNAGRKETQKSYNTGYLAGLNAGRKETQKSYNTGYLAGLNAGRKETQKSYVEAGTKVIQVIVDKTNEKIQNQEKQIAILRSILKKHGISA
jgi:flagellar biosynthesis/type III secretory pathway protein FliH